MKKPIVAFVGVALAAGTLVAETPDAFLPFVESDGTQYFDTGVIGKSYTKMEMDFRYTASPGNGVYIMGSCSTADQTWSHVSPWYYNYGNGYYYGGNLQNSYGYMNPFNAHKRYQTRTVLEPNKQTITWLDTGKIFSTSGSYSGSTERNMYLFALNNGGTAKMSGVQARLYAMKIWQKASSDGDYDLVADLRPCRKDGKVGLYDAVTETILYPLDSEGNETTIYGPRSDPWEVYATDTDGMTPIQQLTNAVAQAGKGDTILIHRGTYVFPDDVYMSDNGRTPASNPSYCKIRLNLTADDVTLMGEDTTSRKTWTVGAEPVVLDGNGGRILQVRLDKNSGCALIKNIAFANGFGGNYGDGTQSQSYYGNYCAGGAIGLGDPFSGGCPGTVITNCVFRGNRACCGSAVSSKLIWREYPYTTYSIQDCLFTNNTAVTGQNAASVYYGYLYGCDFVDNSGGGNYISGAYDCRFWKNAYSGSFLFAYKLQGCQFWENSSSSLLLTVPISMEDCHFTNNAATSWGLVYARGTYCQDSTVNYATVTNCTFHKNQVGNQGRAAVTDAGLVVDCRFTENSGYHAGGISVTQTNMCMTVKDCHFVNNDNACGGAGVVLRANYSATAAEDLKLPVITIDHCTFETNNCSSAYGGAVACSATNIPDGIATNALVVCSNGCLFVRNRGWCGGVKGVTARGCVFRDNNVSGDAFNYKGDAMESRLEACDLTGGNLYRCSVDRCRIHNVTNAGVFNIGCSVTNTLIENCSLLKNFQALIGRYAYSDVPIGSEFVNCTFANNWGTTIKSATHADDVVFRNCAFFGNTNQEGVVTALSWDDASKKAAETVANVTFDHCAYGPLAGAAPAPAAAGGNILCTNPRFNRLRDETHPYYEPRANSPLKDAGADVGFTADDLDLAGQKRLNGPVDIGCYESYLLLKQSGIAISIR